MVYDFKIQDPSNPSTTFLLEEIIQIIRTPNLVKWRGLYSWTTNKTLTKLFEEDVDIKRYIESGVAEFVIGLDAITTDYALKKLVELNDKYTGFSSKVFHNDISDLFHPKVSHFQFESGENVLLVGSGNFTLTGLQTNIEAYTIATGTNEEIKSISVWDEFLNFHAERITDIDDKAIEKAKKNKAWFKKKKKKAFQQGTEELEEPEEIIISDITTQLNDNSRVLLAYVPSAGNRWKQIHYNQAVISGFFQASPNSHQRVFLKEVKLDGTLGTEEVRPVIYSTSNKNYKIEISGRPDAKYSSDRKPIIVLREVGVRNFIYSLILPIDAMYGALDNYMQQNDGIGKGLKRLIIASSTLKKIWPKSILHQENTEEDGA